jgi:hypothetical protein
MSKKRILVTGAGWFWRGRRYRSHPERARRCRRRSYLAPSNQPTAESEIFLTQAIGHEEARLDPKEMIDAMVSIVPDDAGKVRNVVPKTAEEFLKAHQKEAWEIVFDSEIAKGSFQKLQRVNFRTDNISQRVLI